jgi:hypothetical protein
VSNHKAGIFRQRARREKPLPGTLGMLCAGIACVMSFVSPEV